MSDVSTTPGRERFPTSRIRLVVQGQVQGVGFRPFVYRLASEMGLTGHVRNSPRGVQIDVQGPPDAVERFARRVVEELLLSRRFPTSRGSSVPLSRTKTPFPSCTPPPGRATKCSSVRTLRYASIACLKFLIRRTVAFFILSPIVPTADLGSPSPVPSPTIARKRQWRVFPCARRVRTSTTIQWIVVFTHNQTPVASADREFG